MTDTDRRTEPAPRRTNAGQFVRRGVVTLKDREAAFWSEVDKSEGCWLWRGKGNPRHEYGQFYVGWDGKRYAEVRAHRAAWQLTNGQIPPMQDVLHKCDNPKCVRPDHLFLGDRKANMRDAASKGRLHWQKAVEIARKVDGLFTWEDVDAIRAVANGWTMDAENHDTMPGLTAHERAIRDRALSAADRLAALLPPR